MISLAWRAWPPARYAASSPRVSYLLSALLLSCVASACDAWAALTSTRRLSLRLLMIFFKSCFLFIRSWLIRSLMKGVRICCRWWGLVDFRGRAEQFSEDRLQFVGLDLIRLHSGMKLV